LLDKYNGVQILQTVLHGVLNRGARKWYSKKKRDKEKNRGLTAIKLVVNLVRLVVKNIVRNARCRGIRNAWCWDPMNACFLLAKRKGFFYGPSIACYTGRRKERCSGEIKGW